MRTDLFDFDLPEELIALRPASPRDAARLLVVRPGNPVAAQGFASPLLLQDRIVRDLPALLTPGDVLVVNDTKVIPAALKATRERNGNLAHVAFNLIRRVDESRWRAFARPAKRLEVGDKVTFAAEGRVCLAGALSAIVSEKLEAGEVALSFSLHGAYLDEAIATLGEMPLPPYIALKRAPDEDDRTSYQTMFAAREGAVAAPTAALHFTPELMASLEARGIEPLSVTLHVGAGTFLPVKADNTEEHLMHSEWGEISAEAAAALNAAKARGGRIVAVGTTALRLLESAADVHGLIRPFSDETDIFIVPGYRFRAVDALVTNFHLPRSTLYMLVSAFAGFDAMRAAYRHAIGARYRFYSYGDASLLFRGVERASEGGSICGLKQAFQFGVHATSGMARAGTIATPRGVVRTPAFMPVGTVGTVKALYPEQVREAGADIILGNVYHLMLRPGAERVARLGGLHSFMRWPGPILTDSGGFQVMSLSQIRKITEEGAAFQSHLDGSRHLLTPERSIEIQCLLGADIQMQLDECIEHPAEHGEAERAMRLSLRWAERSREAFGRLSQPGQALFGIVQGGTYHDLRRTSAEALVAMDLDGYAVGGLAVGEGHDLMLTTLEATVPHLPSAKPRYLMGVGTPEDLIEAVARGIDMFDCVMPTRNGRHGLAFTWNGRVNLRNARHAEDLAPLDPNSSCPAARDWSRAYLHHLVKSGEMLGSMLLSWVNTAFYQELMAAMRTAISEGRFGAWAAETKARLAAKGG